MSARDRQSNTAKATVVVGVCGGIAAYKTVELVSRLRQAGHEVHVAMTSAAEQFVQPLTFAAVSGQRVFTRLFPAADQAAGEATYPHLYPATRANFFVVMPATANTLARLVQGAGDDPVTCSALSLPTACRRLFCPAMNVEMWAQPVVQAHAQQLVAQGWVQLGPEQGALACGMAGAGRMAEPETVRAYIESVWAGRQQLRGKRVLIVSGPTREYLDPVRYLSNASSGRMGQALAETAADRGAAVHFITGPVAATALPQRTGIEMVTVTSAHEMDMAAQAALDAADYIVCAAAVADYRPRERQDTKGAKRPDAWSLELVATPDIAAGLGQRKRPDQRLIGFALQTGDGREAARAKLAAKNLDAIVLNHPEALDANEGTYTWITGNQATSWGTLTKHACANRIWDESVGSGPHIP